jgi:hypothetical protein
MNATLIAVIEMSQSSYRRAGKLVGVVVSPTTRRKTGDHPLPHPHGPRSASFS